MSTADIPGLVTAICEQQTIHITGWFNKRNLYAIGDTAQLAAYISDHSMMAAIRLEAKLPAVFSERIEIREEWPVDWWQAVRQRWLPAWILKRWPVKIRRLDVSQPIFKAVCPHISLSGIDDRHTHIAWLAAEASETPSST